MAPPFAAVADAPTNAVGFSMDVVDALIGTAFEGTAAPSITRTVLGDNNAIIDMLKSNACDPATDESVLCIGAAAISITGEREQEIDFLPTYFMAGLQIMAPIAASVDYVVATIAGNIARQLGLILLFVLWIAVTITPSACLPGYPKNTLQVTPDSNPSPPPLPSCVDPRDAMRSAWRATYLLHH